MAWRVLCYWGDGRVGQYRGRSLMGAVLQMLIWRMKGRRVTLSRELDRPF